MGICGSYTYKKSVYILVLAELFLQKRAHSPLTMYFVEELLQNYAFLLIKSMTLRGSNLSLKI